MAAYECATWCTHMCGRVCVHVCVCACAHWCKSLIREIKLHFQDNTIS